MEAPTTFGAIILAAGLSKRMGGPNKLLQPYRGKPLLAFALETASSLMRDDAGARLSDCVVVTGRDAPEVSAMAASQGLRSVHNPDFAAGLGSSIAIGASNISGDVAGIFVALGDMPSVLAADYDALAADFKPGAIAIPIHKGARGHPVLFCASYRDELAALGGDEGARSILKRHSSALIEVNSENPGVLQDFDEPQDFLL